MERKLAMRLFVRAVMGAALAAALASGPAQAQFSNTYQFIKAVKEKDYFKMQTLVTQPGGTSVLNFPDPESGQTALHIAVDQSNADLMSYLMSRGADPEARDRDGNTPLILSAIKGYAEGIRMALRFKANINAVNQFGETALIKAVQEGQEPIVRLLVQSGAALDVTDSATGLTALEHAQRNRRAVRIAQLLRDAGKPKTAPAAQPSAAGFVPPNP
jgi:uncharacterized protein